MSRQPSTTPNAVRLRTRRAAIKLGAPVPHLTPEEVSERLRAGASERVKRGWETRRRNKEWSEMTTSERLEEIKRGSDAAHLEEISKPLYRKS